MFIFKMYKLRFKLVIFYGKKYLIINSVFK